MANLKTNLRVLAPSRKAPRPGDVFVFQVRRGEFHFGRVISTTARLGNFADCHLIYIYRATSKSKSTIPRLDPRDLLLPPLGTNRKPWTLGYFETVGHVPLDQKNDVLPKHCFRSLTWKNRYFDELGNELPSRTEPCGDYALQSYRTIDDDLSEALGIPLAPEDEEEV